MSTSTSPPTLGGRTDKNTFQCVLLRITLLGLFSTVEPAMIISPKEPIIYANHSQSVSIRFTPVLDTMERLNGFTCGYYLFGNFTTLVSQSGDSAGLEVNTDFIPPEFYNRVSVRGGALFIYPTNFTVDNNLDFGCTLTYSPQNSRALLTVTSKYVRLVILIPPRIVRFDPVQNVIENRTSTLLCIAQGYPKATITWDFGTTLTGERDIFPIVKDSISTDFPPLLMSLSMANVSRLSRYQSRKISCTATIPGAGRDYREAGMEVIYPTLPPTNVLVKDTFTDSITLEWDIPLGGSPRYVRDYVVEYRMANAAFDLFAPSQKNDKFAGVVTMNREFPLYVPIGGSNTGINRFGGTTVGDTGLPVQGQQFPGQQYVNQQFPGQQYPGQSLPFMYLPGQTYTGQVIPGQAGLTIPGQTYSGTTYLGQTYPGQTYPGQTYPGQMYGVQTNQWQPAVGSPRPLTNTALQSGWYNPATNLQNRYYANVGYSMYGDWSPRYLEKVDGFQWHFQTTPLNNYVLAGLRPDTEYILRVRANNGAGFSLPSFEVRSRTRFTDPKAGMQVEIQYPWLIAIIGVTLLLLVMLVICVACCAAKRRRRAAASNQNKHFLLNVEDDSVPTKDYCAKKPPSVNVSIPDINIKSYNSYSQLNKNGAGNTKGFVIDKDIPDIYLHPASSRPPSYESEPRIRYASPATDISTRTPLSKSACSVNSTDTSDENNEYAFNHSAYV